MFSEPEHNLEQLALESGEIVADLGCGSGAYTIAVAKILKGSGRVYAVEVQKELLTRLQNTVRDEGLGNVEFIWGNLEQLGGTKLRDQSVDVVIISNVLFQNDNKQVIVDEARRILRHGGRMLVIDWTGSFNSMGPQPGHVFSEHEARALIEARNLLHICSSLVA
jgi:ubiquinone/menaquinone biosynthesis C-methylase UbiE